MIGLGPCGVWATWDGTCCPNVDLPPAAQTSIEEQASFILWALTGRKFSGICETVIEVCVPCECPVECCCSYGSEIDLFEWWPIQAVILVLVDGVALPSTEWEIRDYRWLTRTDGLRWPPGAGRVQVTIQYGVLPPAGAEGAMQSLMCELAKACYTDQACRLPQRVTSITREGVTLAMLDPFEMLDKGRTGLFEVDLWLEAVNRATRMRPGIADPAFPSVTSRVT